MGNLTEKYRPDTWKEVVGQAAAIRQIATAVKVSGIGGQAWYFIGRTGVGKTTMAYLLAHDFADPLNITEIDSQWATPKRLREIEAEFGQGGLDFGNQGRTGKAYIVNEAQELKTDAVKQLLATVERLPDHIAFFFTAMITEDELFEMLPGDRVVEAFTGRCQLVALESGDDTRQAFAERAREIAVKENLNGQAPEAYVELIDRCRGSMRRALQEIAAGKMYNG